MVLTEIKGKKVGFSNWDPGLKFYSHTLGIEFKSDKGLREEGSRGREALEV